MESVVQDLQSLGHKLSILPNRLSVKVNFAAAVIGTLNIDEVPVHGTAVAVVGDFVGLPGGEMETAGDFFVEKDVTHRFLDLRIEADCELADVARSFVGIQDLVDCLGVVRSGFDDLAVLEFELYVVERNTLVNGRGIVGDHAFYRVFDGRRETFTVGDIVSSSTGNAGKATDGKPQVGAGSHDVDFFRFAHQVGKGLHALFQFAVIEQTNAEIEVFEGLSGHSGALGHRGVGPAQDAPPGLVDSLVEDGPHLGGKHLHLFRRNIGEFVHIVATPNGDVAVHRLHLMHRVLGDGRILIFGGSHGHFSADA